MIVGMYICIVQKKERNLDVNYKLRIEFHNWVAGIGC